MIDIPPAPKRPNQEPVGVILTETLCDSCGYDLRGQPRSGRCPECGTPIRAETDHYDPISVMPEGFIRRIRSGNLIATVALIAGAILGVSMSQAWWTGEVPAYLLVAAATLWALAGLMVTPAARQPEAIGHGFGHRDWLRRAARWLQPIWPLWAVVHAQHVLAGPVPGLNATLSGILEQMLVLTGGIGLAAIAFHLQRVAAWTKDESAELGYGIFGWGMLGIGVVGIAWELLFSRLIPGFVVRAPILPLFGLVIVFGCVLAFPYAMISLSQSLAWSVYHARERVERERRRDQRQRSDAEMIAARLSDIDTATGTSRPPP